MTQSTMQDSACRLDYTVMAADLNGYGIMHGGRLLTLCDEVGYLAAHKHARGSCLTKAVHQARFHRPVYAGENISLRATVGLTGRSSLWVHVEVRSADDTCLMDGAFVYAAIDEHGHTRPVTAIRAVTEADIQLQDRLQAMQQQVLPAGKEG